MEILTFKFLPHINSIEVIFRERSNLMYLTNPPKPMADRIWKEIYSVNEAGKIILAETKDGRHIPAYTSIERFEFD